MISINEKGKIKILRYKAIYDNAEMYFQNKEEIPNGLIVEELDVSSEMFLDGIECPDIPTAYKWLELGETAFNKMKRDEIIRNRIAETYPRVEDELAILFRGTAEEKALHEQVVAEAKAYADEVMA